MKNKKILVFVVIVLCVISMLFIGLFYYRDSPDVSSIEMKESNETTTNDTTKEIADSVFEGCTILKIISIPSSIEKMGAYVFYGNNMTDIYFGVSEPGENWNEKWDEGLNGDVNIHWSHQ